MHWPPWRTMPVAVLLGNAGVPPGPPPSPDTTPEWTAALRATLVSLTDALSQPDRDRPAIPRPTQPPAPLGRVAPPPEAARPDDDGAADDVFGEGQPTSSDTPSPVSTPEVAREVSDADLVMAAQANPEAFAELYARYFVPIYRYCLVRLGNATDAEDVASVVFARALGALPRFEVRAGDPGGGFRSWLFAIAHNALANAHRDRRPAMSLDAAHTIATTDPTPEDHAITADRIAHLRAGLDQLSDDQRRVVELRLAGLKGPEIAQTLNKSHGAVKMLQLRAIDRLRTLLSGPLAESTREVPNDKR